jgi:uncharacterized membrane protein (UPF0136 family)
MSFHISATSAALTLGAGAYGYATTGSKPSLIGGAALASAFLASAYLVRKTDYQCTGHSVAALAGTVAFLIGARRMNLKTLSGIKVGPSTLLIVGILNIPYQSLKAYEWRS